MLIVQLEQMLNLSIKNQQISKNINEKQIRNIKYMKDNK